MKALILNSGLGSRMGVLTAEHPKCMTDISSTDTILSRQLRQLEDYEIRDVVITTGAFDQVLTEYADGLDLQLDIRYVHNPIYRETNYIYSIYQAREQLRDTDLLLMHGDLVFENTVLDRLMESGKSTVAVSTTAGIPEKDFKAVVEDHTVRRIGVEFFENVVASQPLYYLTKEDWAVWLDRICAYCERGEVNCYAEKALNEVTDRINMKTTDMGDLLCQEVDNPTDLELVTGRLEVIQRRTVYMAFSTGVLHSGHYQLIRKAGRLGRLIVGLLTDEVISGYKQTPWLPISERKVMFSALKGVWRVVEQDSLSYRKNLECYRPDYVVHGDDWRSGPQAAMRQEVIDILAQWNGTLVEYPYSGTERYASLERKGQLSQRIFHDYDGEDGLANYLQSLNVVRPMLVCGDEVHRNQLDQGIQEVLKRLGMETVRFSAFMPNPEQNSVTEGVGIFRKRHCDMLIAVGGGSAMDVAKCIRLYVGFGAGGDIFRPEQFHGMVPFLAVPTTAGSGSEATQFAVIYRDGKKQSVTHEGCVPTAVFMDSHLLCTLPLYQRKATLLDALCHAVESCWSVQSTAESREYALEALRLIVRSREGYLTNTEEGNRNMLYAANLAGRAINIAKTTAGHAMSYQLTTRFGLAHGHAVALCDRVLWKYTEEHIEKIEDPVRRGIIDRLMAQMGELFGKGGIAGYIAGFDLEIPTVRDEEELRMLAEGVNTERLGNYPIRLDTDTLMELYRKCLR